MEWIAYFLLYSFIGWIIDSGYRSWVDRKWTMGNALKPLPFAPVYGFGAIFVLIVEPVVGHWAIVFQWLAYGVLLAILEGFSGMFSTEVFGKPLWKYHRSNSFDGYTDIWHAAIWGLLALVLTWVMHPVFMSMWFKLST